LAGDEPIEDHADRCEVLFDRRVREPLLQLLHVGRYRDGHDGRQREPTVIGPSHELGDRLGVGRSRVVVLDVRREEFEEAAGGSVASLGDDGREQHPCGLRLDADQLGFGLQCIHAFRSFALVRFVGHNAEDFIRECHTRSLAVTESRLGTLG
jgi:hypothetical protein